MDTKERRLSITIGAALHRALKRKALEEDTTIKELVIKWIREKLGLPSEAADTSLQGKGEAANE